MYRRSHPVPHHVSHSQPRQPSCRCHEVRNCAVVAIVGRVLRVADLKPWQYDYWLFPRDPRFAETGGVILNLCGGYWQGGTPR